MVNRDEPQSDPSTWDLNWPAISASLTLGVAASFAAIVGAARAQELEPRSYSPAPIGSNFVVVGYGASSGSVVFDGAAPISDAEADINLATIGYSRVFDLGGHQTSIAVAAPYLWGDASGNVGETTKSITRSGFGDMRLKVSTLLVGGPALSRQEFATRQQRPIVGASLLVVAPTGEYMSDKLINLGSNRWAFKPEIGLSYPMGRWQADAYAGVWIYGENDNFLGRAQRREPMATAQAHLSYTIRPGLWAALDATYYAGGATVIRGVRDLNRQENVRVGASLSIPIMRGQSVQLHYGRGALTRFGGDFDSFAISWRALWY